MTPIPTIENEPMTMIPAAVAKFACERSSSKKRVRTTRTTVVWISP